MLTRHRWLWLCFALISSAWIVPGVARAQDTEEWLPLFNGRDLEGWDIKLKGHALNADPSQTFRFADGVLRVSYDEYEAFDSDFGHLFYEKKLSHYRLRLEYRFLGEQTPGGPEWAIRNSGVMFHSQSASSMGIEQDFPICVEAQLLGGNGVDERPTANLCTPGTHVVMDGKLEEKHCINSSSKTYHGHEWVPFELTVLGGERIEHAVHGETVLSYSKPQIGGGAVDGFDESLKEDGRILEEGYISLQAESHPVEFRNVELLDLVGCLDEKARNYKSYFVRDDRERCEYE